MVTYLRDNYKLKLLNGIILCQLNKQKKQQNIYIFINEDKTLKGFELSCHIEHLLGVNELSFKVNK